MASLNKNLTVRVPEHLLVTLDSIAETTPGGISRSDLVRGWVHSQVSRHMDMPVTMHAFKQQCYERGVAAEAVERALINAQLAFWTGSTSKGLTGLFYRISLWAAKRGL